MLYPSKYCAIGTIHNIINHKLVSVEKDTVLPNQMLLFVQHDNSDMLSPPKQEREVGQKGTMFFTNILHLQERYRR